MLNSTFSGGIERVRQGWLDGSRGHGSFLRGNGARPSEPRAAPLRTGRWRRTSRDGTPRVRPRGTGILTRPGSGGKGFPLMPQSVVGFVAQVLRDPGQRTREARPQPTIGVIAIRCRSSRRSWNSCPRTPRARSGPGRRCDSSRYPRPRTSRGAALPFSPRAARARRGHPRGPRRPTESRPRRSGSRGPWEPRRPDAVPNATQRSRLGGRIEVESLVGRGTAVRLHLPAVAPPAAPSPAPAPPNTVAGRAAVLVVDEDPRVARSIAWALPPNGSSRLGRALALAQLERVRSR